MWPVPFARFRLLDHYPPLEPRLFWFMLRINHQHLLDSQFSEQDVGLGLSWVCVPALNSGSLENESIFEDVCVSDGGFCCGLGWIHCGIRNDTCPLLVIENSHPMIQADLSWTLRWNCCKCAAFEKYFYTASPLSHGLFRWGDRICHSLLSDDFLGFFHERQTHSTSLWLVLPVAEG